MLTVHRIYHPFTNRLVGLLRRGACTPTDVIPDIYYSVSGRDGLNRKIVARVWPEGQEPPHPGPGYPPYCTADEALELVIQSAR